MSNDPSPVATADSLEGDALEARVAQFEAAWQAGKVPQIRDYVSVKAAPLSDDAQQLLLQLVAVDMEYRWRADRTQRPADDELGLAPNLAHYARHFASSKAFDPLPAWLAAEEYRARRLWGDAPTHDQFFANYPQLFPELVSTLRKVDAELAVDQPTPWPIQPTLHIPAVDPRAPLLFADYLLQQHLGTGGMGKVFRAIERRLGRPVAIKALLKSRQGDRRAVEQFVQEAHIVAGLAHPNIVGIHGLGRFPGGGYFLVMDLVEGGDLAFRLKDGTLPLAEALRITADVALAIQFAHEQGVVHCDLKPANVLLDKTGKVFVADFGLAHLLRGPGNQGSRHIGGTFAYMAPEVLHVHHYQPAVATDVYGLGALLCTVLTGDPPGELWKDLPTGVAGICKRCLCANPDGRYPTAAAVREALLAALIESPG